MIQELLTWVQDMGPWGIFTFLILCSFGLPIAKSLLLILAGMLAHQNQDQLTAYFLAGFLGLHCGDFALFLIGTILDEGLFQFPVVRRIIPKRAVTKAKQIIEEHGTYSLVIARLTPYIRGACYLMLGSLRMPILKFSFINASICAIYSLFFFVPGYFLVSQLENLKKISKYGNLALFGLFVLILVGFILRLRFKKHRAQKQLNSEDSNP